MTLVWCFCLLAGFTLFFAIILVQQVAWYLKTDLSKISGPENKLLYKHFGSVQVSCLSLFQCFSGGTDWGDMYAMIAPIGPITSLLFFVFMGTVWLGLANIVASIFVDKAFRCSMPDTDDLVIEKRKSDLQTATALAGLFRSITSNESHASNILTLSQLEDCLNDVRLATYFEMHGLAVSDARTFYELLASRGDGIEVDVDTFVSSFLMLKGPAHCVDVILLRYQLGATEARLQKAWHKSVHKTAKLLQKVLREGAPTSAHKVSGRRLYVKRPAQYRKKSTSHAAVDGSSTTTGQKGTKVSM